ncbi:lipopolysaccharide heptosyltransferase II [Hydrogenothermus marinus]|uniref:lipopolysaccharide heptosyltransferase II n=1 Tax=Hydrogenothermus marinus TaxID=133270 RepID=A0A3M0BFA6_9AQUI|nr:lipopolysaccharide heptosyltransferase II [Hydrogenothermus marinus]RMA96000.1 heptosyltransferase-2 [Hydrogenothermus marinus]
MKKIILWQTAFLGDLILTTPLIASIKNIFPNSKLHIITKPFGKQVLKNNPYVNKLIIFDKSKDSTLKLIKDLRKEKYDLAISPHRSHRAAYSLFLAGIPERVGFDKGGFSFLYTKKAKHAFDGIHEIDRNFRLLKALDKNISEENFQRFPQLFLTKEEDQFYKSIGLQDKDYLLIAPGSKWKTKRWTAKGFADLIKKLYKKENIVLIGGKEDKQFTDEILKIAQLNPINLVGKTDLRQTFSLIKHSKGLISNDSAPVHMAVAFNIPVVDIYGPTVKDFGFYPYRNGIIVEIKDLKCRPCGLHGHNNCPINTHECMEKITADMVLDALKSLIPDLNYTNYI